MRLLDIKKYIINKEEPPKYLYYQYLYNHMRDCELIGLDIIQDETTHILLTNTYACVVGITNRIENIATEIYYTMKIANLCVHPKNIQWYECELDQNLDNLSVNKTHIDKVELEWSHGSYESPDWKRMKEEDLIFNIPKY